MNTLPYDVVQEIFIHSLPLYPLRSYDMRTEDIRRHQLVPMILCHVCTFWRMVAFTTPILWSHLSAHLTIDEFESDFDWYIVSENQIEFIRWWKSHQGSVIPPFLTLTATVGYVRNQYRPRHKKPLASESEFFLLDYLTSAQYLDIDVFFWHRVGDIAKEGGRVAFPNLHTVIEDVAEVQSTDLIIPFLRVHNGASPLTSISRFHIDGVILPSDAIFADTSIHVHDWARLSHISMTNVCMSFLFWDSLVRSACNLENGFFHIIYLGGRFIASPGKSSLLQLATLTVICELNMQGDEDIRYPLSYLFNELHLPALCTLSLYSSVDTWKDYDSIDEVSSTIRAAPNLVTLNLQDCFLSFEDYVEPLWRRASSLTHLRLENSNHYSTEYVMNSLDIFICSISSHENGWLDLEDPACRIRTITFIVSQLQDVEEFATTRILELAEKLPGIRFELTSQSHFEEMREQWREWVDEPFEELEKLVAVSLAGVGESSSLRFEAEALDIFLENLLTREFGWLDLANTECSIRIVTLIVCDVDIVKNFATACILELSEMIQRVEFKLKSNSTIDERRDVWNLSGVHSDFLKERCTRCDDFVQLQNLSRRNEWDIFEYEAEASSSRNCVKKLMGNMVE
ncbi:hypothetical protein BDN70DRAFT_901339 [Pholiota conissans]|uniref:F-box domain-containing protein n=1 Tax=Pholiota conissans TaxID=109636 RepID=A0A9P5YKF3_9AGAR|nr:hypothetical protein BDN70DRAFT_901339 [Pholiota conissans]